MKFYVIMRVGDSMKVLKIIKSIISGILLFVYFSFVIAMTVLLLNFNDYGVTEFGNTSLIIINDEISNDNYKKGDLVITKKEKIEKLNVGTEIFAYKVDSKGNVSIDLGKIGNLYPEENALSFENGSTYSMDFVAGTPQEVHEKIGTYLSIVESKWGFLFIVLVPSFLIFVYEIYSLIVEIKYGADEE